MIKLRSLFSRSEPSAHIDFKVGSYRLDAPTGDITGLVEFSPEEYALMPKLFKHEISYNAPPVLFLDRQWNLMLQAVNGKVSKIAPYMELTAKTEADKIASDVLTFCLRQLGRPSKRRAGRVIWDANNGNVILEAAECSDGLNINLFLTSRSLRAFERL
jgi:hypothetical protein